MVNYCNLVRLVAVCEFVKEPQNVRWKSRNAAGTGSSLREIHSLQPRTQNLQTILLKLLWKLVFLCFCHKFVPWPVYFAFFCHVSVLYLVCKGIKLCPFGPLCFLCKLLILFLFFKGLSEWKRPIRFGPGSGTRRAESAAHRQGPVLRRRTVILQVGSIDMFTHNTKHSSGPFIFF